MTGLIPRTNGDLAANIGETTETSWSPPANITFDQWEQIGNTLQTINGAVNWWIGDWLNVGERQWGDTYTQAVQSTDSSVESLKKYKSVSERVPQNIRCANLSWTHHFYVAYQPAEERGPLLAIADAYNLSSRELKELKDAPDEWRKLMIETFVNNVCETYNELTYLAGQKQVDGTKPPKEEVTLQEPVLDIAGSAQNGSLGTEQGQDLPFSDELTDFDEDSEEIEWMEEDAESEQSVFDFLESHGIEIIVATRSSMEFQDGFAVMAAKDDKGEAILLWQVPDF